MPNWVKKFQSEVNLVCIKRYFKASLLLEWSYTCLTCTVTNAVHFIEQSLAQSCFVAKWNSTLRIPNQHWYDKHKLVSWEVFLSCWQTTSIQLLLHIQDKQSIILRLEKETSLSSEYGISKQRISDIRKNKDKIMKFANNLKSDHGLKQKSLKVAHDEQLDEALQCICIV